MNTNMKKIVLALMAVGTCVSAPQAFAARSTYGGSGTLHFQGGVTDGACTIDTTSVNQTISLPEVKVSRLKSAGDVAGETDFHIKLTDCDITTFHTAMVKFTGISGVTGTPANTFSPDTSAADRAKNVGLQIKDSGGHVLTPSLDSTPQALTPGTDQIDFTAAYQAGAAVTPGSFNATVGFAVDYQ
ncbi:major type 1 subunit fimbrin (pilin) [Cedecea sp. NFIX57]|nr:major type 1 subunit fimbrin (pilin) [Cedecea sp. NFIX57]